MWLGRRRAGGWGGGGGRGRLDWLSETHWAGREAVVRRACPLPGFGFRALGFGFRGCFSKGMSSSGFRASGFGLRVVGFGFRISRLFFVGHVLFWASGFGLRVAGFGFRISRLLFEWHVLCRCLLTEVAFRLLTEVAPFRFIQSENIYKMESRDRQYVHIGKQN